MPSNIRISRKDSGREIPGTYLRAFIHNGDYFLTDIQIYADQKIECWGLVDFATFQQKVRSGWVVTQIPDQARVNISGMTSFTASDVNAYTEPEEFIKEVADEIRSLNGEPTSDDKCRAAYQAFLAGPTEVSRDELKKAYEAVPAHLRAYILRDQDAKDSALRKAIYGDHKETE